MAIQLDPDLPAPLVPLAWLVGVWAGAGIVGYPSMSDTRFGQEIEFSHDGRPFLAYSSKTWLLDDDGERVRPLARESGFWRVPSAAQPAERAEPAGSAQPVESVADGTALEVLLAHPTGYVELYVGAVQGPRVTLATDLVARTTTAKEYTAATRLYGLVEGDLLWVMEMAAVGEPMAAHVSARLKRV